VRVEGEEGVSGEGWEGVGKRKSVRRGGGRYCGRIGEGTGVPMFVNLHLDRKGGSVANRFQKGKE